MDEVPLTANELATNRTTMAFDRTVMALERTLMGWIRTALSLISFGFTIFKFLEALQQRGDTHMRDNAPRNLGFALIVLGMGSLTLAIFQFRRALAGVERFSEMKLPTSLSLITAIGVLTVGFFALLNLFFGFGGF
jgi:putative membrane protein